MRGKLLTFFIALFLCTNLMGQTSVTNFTSYGGVTIETITTTIVLSNGLYLNPIIKSPISTVLPTTNASTGNVATNLVSLFGGSTNEQKIANTFLNNFIDSAPYFKNNIINFDSSVLYNISHKSLGFFAGFDVPISQQAALGAGVLNIDHQIDILPLSVKLGISIPYPYIGTVYNFIGTGSLISTTGKFGSYSFLGGVRTWDLTSKLELSIGFDIGDISLVSGIDVGGVCRLDWHF